MSAKVCCDVMRLAWRWGMGPDDRGRAMLTLHDMHCEECGARWIFDVTDGPNDGGVLVGEQGDYFCVRIKRAGEVTRDVTH
jgi:hypothetical protein